MVQCSVIMRERRAALMLQFGQRFLRSITEKNSSRPKDPQTRSIIRVMRMLDDPNGELDGPSHVMYDAECMSESVPS